MTATTGERGHGSAAAPATPPHRPTVAIVGAGPAGLMAAEVAAAAGLDVTLYERMPSPARKLLIAGRGGLNLTHAAPMPQFLERYGAGRALVARAIDTFPPEALLAWCHDLGIATFEGTSGRHFPVGLKASPLLRAWLGRLDDSGVRLRTRHHWTGWAGDGALTFDTPTGPLAIRADATVLALGGASWPRLGSDGSWTAPLGALGVAIAPLTPSNCGILINWSDVFRSRFEGTPVKRVAVRVGDRQAKGEALITSTGLEGGAIYAVADALRAAGLDAGRQVTVSLDLRPDRDEAALAAALSAPFGKEPLTNVLRKRAGLAPVAIGLLREAAGRALPREAVALARLIKHCGLEATAFAGLGRAISTAGGICASELDESFMLKGRPGVFAAGEMLDWDAPTGGFLLQAAIATGRAAGAGVVDWLGVTATTTAHDKLARTGPKDV